MLYMTYGLHKEITIRKVATLKCFCIILKKRDNCGKVKYIKRLKDKSYF